MALPDDAPGVLTSRFPRGELMSDKENLHERVETNFRLSAIYTRQMGRG
jgi:hypothetical protein